MWSRAETETSLDKCSWTEMIMNLVVLWSAQRGSMSGLSLLWRARDMVAMMKPPARAARATRATWINLCCKVVETTSEWCGDLPNDSCTVCLQWHLMLLACYASLSEPGMKLKLAATPLQWRLYQSFEEFPATSHLNFNMCTLWSAEPPFVTKEWSPKQLE